MIIVGFVETNGNLQALNLFNEICEKNNLIVSKSIESNADIISIPLKYEDFFNERYNFVKFDILIFENCGIIKEKFENSILNIISKRNILIINLDDKRILKFLKGNSIKLITYGLNYKSCITTSSIQSDENILQELECCIQRIIPTFKLNKLEPQEFKVVLKKYKSNNISNNLAAISAAIICDIPIKFFENIVL